MYPVSPTAKNLPSLLIERHVAAFILSRLVQVLDEGESPQSYCVGPWVDAEYTPPVWLNETTLRFRESLAVLVGVEGGKPVDIVEYAELLVTDGTAAGRARKKR
jgi:hypothetical protein